MVRGELPMLRTIVCVVTLWCAALAARGAEPPGCAPAVAARCEYVGGGTGGGTTDHEYQVEGNKLIIDFAVNKLNVQCYGRPVLDSLALPSFSPSLRVRSVRLSRCPPPGAGRSLAAALSALNVTLPLGDIEGRLALESLPPEPPLAATHFLGLERLAALTLSAAETPAPAPAPGFLSPLASLRALAVRGVRLAPADLDLPPRNLTRLSLQGTRLGRLPAALLALPHLEHVTLDEERLEEFAAPAGLRSLAVYTHGRPAPRLGATAALETLSLDRWAERSPRPWPSCESLVALQLTSPALEQLPAGWVAACARLERLVVQAARALTALPPRLLERAAGLRELTVRQCALAHLPEGLLDHVPELRLLDLRDNHLRTLPSGTFVGPRALTTLHLASNDLSSEALPALAALQHLQLLNLGNNPRLGAGVCDSGYSPINTLTKLKSLFLNKTNISRICEDWRYSMTVLETLNLEYTNISELGYEELQYTRHISSAEVLLHGAPVAVVQLSSAEYEAALRAPAPGATLYLDSRLACDCRMYWTRRALERAPHAVRVRGLLCSSRRPLAAVPPEEMYCAAPAACRAAGLPRGCTCARRPRDGGHLVRADCAAAGLDRVPALRPANGTLYRLLLPRNRISTFAAADLPPQLQELDLRDNLISAVDAEAVTALGRVSSLHLGGNPLACSCSAASLVRALQTRAGAAEELAGVVCAGGGALAAARAEPCAARLPPAAWAAAALAALVALAAAATACLASRERRVFLKVVLYRWGVLRRAAEPDDGRRFDAFVSFSHEDEEVVSALVARLEGGPAPYRLCLHYRDWVPGRWIPDQIVESVRQSRRTLALVSRHFLESTWARAEFREAHAHALRDVTPRLVVVLLEEPAALPLDSELRRYLSANTYVRWGDPWFWDKLALALPTPRRLPVAPDVVLELPPASPPPAEKQEPHPSPVSSIKRPFSEDRPSPPPAAPPPSESSPESPLPAVPPPSESSPESPPPATPPPSESSPESPPPAAPPPSESSPGSPPPAAPPTHVARGRDLREPPITARYLPFRRAIEVAI